MSTNISVFRDLNEDETERGLPRDTFASVLPRWWSVTRLWLTGHEKWLARGYLAAAIIVNILYTALLVQVSYAQRDLSTAMSEKKIDKFYKSVWMFVVIICIAAPLFASNYFVESRLSLAWRRYLVETLLNAYYGNKAFFLLNAHADELDNPDQRICDDVKNFVSASVLITMNLSRKLLNCIAFAGVLWSISPKLVLFLLLYASAGTYFTGSVFGRPLMRLNFQILHREGDLRYSLVRVRENAESIAFYAGQDQEKSNTFYKFDRIVRSMFKKINWATGLELWKNAYNFATILIPSLMTAPRYFSGEVEFGVIAQATYAFDRMNDALITFVDKFQEISGLSAQTERLMTLMDLMNRIDKDETERPNSIIRDDVNPPAVLRIEQLDFKTPGGEQVIAAGQDLVLHEGESLLVMGPSGCGKSSLLRVLSGLWKHGKGRVSLPRAANLFFLPQKPYMPLGNFRQQLLFPRRQEFDIPDAKLETLLEELRLGHVLQRFGGFDADIDWAQVLSLGEQQRIAFLRLFLRAPPFAILDEATSALDTETESQVYSTLHSLCRSYISVGHRPQLMAYHTHILEYHGKGSWIKKRIGESDVRERSNSLLD